MRRHRDSSRRPARQLANSPRNLLVLQLIVWRKVCESLRFRIIGQKKRGQARRIYTKPARRQPWKPSNVQLGKQGLVAKRRYEPAGALPAQPANSPRPPSNFVARTFLLFELQGLEGRWIVAPAEALRGRGLVAKTGRAGMGRRKPSIGVAPSAFRALALGTSCYPRPRKASAWATPAALLRKSAKGAVTLRVTKPDSSRGA